MPPSRWIWLRPSKAAVLGSNPSGGSIYPRPGGFRAQLSEGCCFGSTPNAGTLGLSSNWEDIGVAYRK